MKDLVHVKAPGNWINDPNGFIYYKGKYHLFFQHFPYAPEKIHRQRYENYVSFYEELKEQEKRRY